MVLKTNLQVWIQSWHQKKVHSNGQFGNPNFLDPYFNVHPPKLVWYLKKKIVQINY